MRALGLEHMLEFFPSVKAFLKYNECIPYFLIKRKFRKTFAHNLNDCNHRCLV